MQIKVAAERLTVERFSPGRRIVNEPLLLVNLSTSSSICEIDYSSLEFISKGSARLYGKKKVKILVKDVETAKEKKFCASESK